MTKYARNPVEDLRGATRLAVEATKGVTDLVEAMHHAIGGGPGFLGRPFAGLVKLFTKPTFMQIRGVAGLVGGGIDLALSKLAPLVGENQPGADREMILAVVNGVLGDYLEESENPLAISMRFRRAGQALKFSKVGGRKVVVLLHGSCANDLQFNRRGHDHGAALERDLGFTPVYLHYNSGLHVSTNGSAFAELMEKLVTTWSDPIDELVLLGHSMGGLVARSACHIAETRGHAWRRKLGKLICVGTPHHGAPMERGGSWIDQFLEISEYSAPLARLGKIRSAGVTDLRHGYVLDEHWLGRARFGDARDARVELALPAGVGCYAIAATKAPDAKAKLRGDGTVPVASALGRHMKPELTLEFPRSQQWIGYGMGHLDLLNRPEVYAKIRDWLGSKKA